MVTLSDLTSEAAIAGVDLIEGALPVVIVAGLCLTVVLLFAPRWANTRVVRRGGSQGSGDANPASSGGSRFPERPVLGGVLGGATRFYARGSPNPLTAAAATPDGEPTPTASQG